MKFTAGDVVWAPYADDEYRFRVVAVDGARVTLKRPGGDGGTFAAEVVKCFPTGKQPSTLEEVHHA